MKILHWLPFGDLKLPLVCSLLFVFVSCSDETEEVTPSSSAPAHRGAARQMFGSGALRPPGKKPIFATGQRQHGSRTTLSPILDPHIIYPQKSPMFPYPYPLDQWGGYPIFINPKAIPPGNRDNFPILRRAGSNGFGRKIEPGFVMEPEDILPKSGGSGGSGGVDENLGKHGTDSEGPCGGDCNEGEFLCVKSCICIKMEDRCNGLVDCIEDEDELDCGENQRCEDTDNFIQCPRTPKCISKEFLCDGDDDCGDYSDETHCGFANNCTSEQFECANGLCIPKNWICDNDNDCKDYSDELNCTKTDCTKDEFECGDGTCISISWKCDREIDCADGLDEAECSIPPSFCNSDEFQCASQQCIKMEFKCDGTVDCDDWSDENDCPAPSGNCVSGEFKCNNNKCIPERYRCDKQQDCDENEDEANCDYSTMATCSPEEFACENGACILKTWVCDGSRDCSQGEDEAKCEIACDESKFSCTGRDSNTTEFCISHKHVCDGQKDCPKGEDELNCPKKRDCEEGTKCKQRCITTSTGQDACACFAGYSLAADGFTCEDINECLYATDPVCSQTCNNTIGSFRCGCMTGYVLRPDLRSCKAMGAPPTLLFANRIDIRQVSLSSPKYTAILKGLHNAIALDYHYDKHFIYWSDVTMDVIRRSYANGTGISDIIKWGLESPGGIALDWIHDLIFWTDSGTRRIEVATLDGQQRAIIISNEIDKPRAIAVHPGEALVFWTDWGPFPKIERSEMDGSNRKSVITESVFWPNGLTLDYTSNRIYWADAKHNVIETALYDGSDRKKVISRGLPHPFAITIFEDAIYWTDWHTKSITTANKQTGAGLRIVHSKLHFPMDIHSYHPQRQPHYTNRCGRNNGGCAHMCVPNKTSYSCFCRMGQKLKSDKKSCQSPDKFLVFATKKDLRIMHLDVALPQHEMVIPIDRIKSAVAIAWDSKTEYIYWTDIDKETINRAYWNGSSQQVIVENNLNSPTGLALDWLTDKIYWTDEEMARIEVAKINGEMRSLLIWENLEKPRSIVVDPLNGVMYWSDWGKKPRIEKANMDGSGRTIIIDKNLTYPNGLAIDHQTSKIYWTDGGRTVIEYADFDGKNRKILIQGESVPHPSGLDVFGNSIYWTDWQTLNIEKANKLTGQNRTIIAKSVNGLMDVQLFHRNRKIVKTPCHKENGGCSHLCLLKPKGHRCACPTGITLGEDGKTCAKGPLNFLIVAHRVDIRQISLDVPYLADVVLPFPQLKLATSVDADRKTGEIYWTDTAKDLIQKSAPNGKDMEVIISHEIRAPEGLAVDSTGRKIYWTDGERNSIEVAELNGSNRKVLFSKDLDNPRAITLHYHHGLIYWSDWGKKAKIEVAHMDGTNRKTLISEKLVWPNGLAIDRPKNRLYWNDAKLNTIESSDLKGNDRRIIVKSVPHPYGLVVVGNHIYWTDWSTKALHRADKINGSDQAIIKDKLEGLMDVRSVQNENIAENACGTNNGGCSHLCLRNPNGYTCACPTGLKISKDNAKICDDLPNKFLLIATKNALSRISLDTEEIWDVTLEIPEAHNVIDVDFHWEKKLIFFNDIGRNTICAVPMHNMSDVRVIVKDNLASPDGISVDWIANNLYWTNTGNKIIEVARLDGKKRKTIVKKDLEDPRSIAVFPRKGLLYWTDWGDHPKIESSYLDGTSRKVLFNAALVYPIGLTIDYANKRIYWIDAKLDNEKIETSDLYGRNRVALKIQGTKPFSLTQFGDFIYWTDWSKKELFRAYKSTGKDMTVIRTQLEAGLGVVFVTESRQMGWNPCAIDNGGCSDLCFFKQKNYSCGCPDDKIACKVEPATPVTLKCPGGSFKCDYIDEKDDEYHPHDFIGDSEEDSETTDHQMNKQHSRMFYIMILVPMLCITLVCVGLIVYLLIKKGKKKYLYASGRSFSNPNYYSNNDPNNPGNNGADRKQFIWKRLKYDKSQERVYEETTGTNSPEIASLIPAILTPCSSNCETVTPELERSPSATPLHKLESSVQPIT